jgi:hypothetical protein
VSGPVIPAMGQISLAMARAFSSSSAQHTLISAILTLPSPPLASNAFTEPSFADEQRSPSPSLPASLALFS